MGKRFLISLLLVVAIVAVVAVGAAVVFSGGYEDLAALEAQSRATPTPELFGQVTLPAQSPEVQAAEPEPEEEASALEAAPSEAETPEVQAPAEEPADTTALQAQTLLEGLTLEEKICQLLFVTPEALTGYNSVTQSGDATKAAIDQYPVGGVIYFSGNLISVDQTTQMLSNIQDFSRQRTGIGLFLGVDEEGGSVARAADSLGTTAFEDMAVYGAEGDSKKAYEIGQTLAADLKPLGFNVDFAPVADVLTNEENTVVRDRSFGSDPELVSDMVSQEVRGLLSGGVLCAPKHFPGHGSTGGDTHDGFAASDRTMEELEDCDLRPFRAAIDAGAPMVMVGHMTMTALDSENPASLSPEIVTGLLREQMGYEGIIITDSLGMGAISDLYTSGEAAVKALEAGCDMLLGITDVEGAVQAVREAVDSGDLTEARIDESVLRILTAKLRFGIIS